MGLIVKDTIQLSNGFSVTNSYASIQHFQIKKKQDIAIIDGVFEIESYILFWKDITQKNSNSPIYSKLYHFDINKSELNLFSENPIKFIYNNYMKKDFNTEDED